jgi:hypothetical protein
MSYLQNDISQIKQTIKQDAVLLKAAASQSSVSHSPPKREVSNEREDQV